MTYCVAIAVNDGLVFTSDSRTNAGVDQISTYSKMHQFGIPGMRQFVILSAGNLATTQGVIKKLEMDIKEGAALNLMSVSSMDDAADYLGQINLAQQSKYGSSSNVSYEASFIIGGQIKNSAPSLFLVYPQGNHIAPSETTPYLQIGESKYGKPILDRILAPDTDLETAALCALVSMDSTMRSNLTVGPPIESLVYSSDSFSLDQHHKLNEGSNFLRELNVAWDSRLREAFSKLSSTLTWPSN